MGEGRYREAIGLNAGANGCGVGGRVVWGSLEWEHLGCGEDRGGGGGEGSDPA